ncbi:DUF3943 domain-containing protein [Sphingobacterium luzhongxinii]|uniref:DUF3943 domain-containing protein n=1 Tax=Sphingobacterium luzhongxinii TaxID=2654181 RepID=UPI0013D8EA7A|nr:DUF3943 domain-containing protein [Sphingobacterium sp. xlx-73]
MRKYLFLFVLLTICSSLVRAGSFFGNIDSLSRPLLGSALTSIKLWKPVPVSFQDTTREILNPQRPKHFWRAGTEWFLAQAFPATFNRFITKDPYSYISFKNFIDHQRFSAWDWDDNQFTTNQIDHPYHGQIYFNAFRSNGYNFYQSSIATLAGSYIWETAGETQSPSINDLVNTTFGGIILGEMTHRVSRNILARSRNGNNVIGNEIVALLVNPVNSLNRLLDGKWGKRVDDYYTVDSSVISAEIDAGFRRFDAKEGDFLSKGKDSFYTRLRFKYSNGDHNYKRPFDQFSVNLEAGNGDSTFINAINVHALLYGAKFFKSKKGEHYGSLNAHYDVYNNDAFFYGAQSLNYNWLSEFTYKSQNKLNLSMGVGAVLLAAVPDPYLLYGASRNYNYGSGASYRFRGDLSVLNRLLFTADYNGGVFYTISGTPSHYILHAGTVEASLRVFKRWSINLRSGYFSLEGKFRDEKYPDFHREYPFGSISIGYNIQF